jgi:putative membrane protein
MHDGKEAVFGMMIMMFLFWAALIVGIVVLIRWLLTTGGSGHQAATRNNADSPLDILKKRYARGEISKQEFDDMRQDLQ